jgi:cell division protein FtsQ
MASNVPFEVTVPKRKKPRKNTRKGRKRGRRIQFIHRLAMGFKVTAAIAAVMIVTGLFILVHDFLTQCEYFRARQLTIEGMRRLTRDQVAQQAGVHTGINILSANLTLVRKRLQAHPWIAEAEVRREIPAGLAISIKEHKALAMVDLGQKYLMNTQGEIFKTWEPSDPKDLPVVSGLTISDLTVSGRSEPVRDDSLEKGSAPFQAVMRVLELGGRKSSILPNREVRQIHVDQQIGLTVHAFERGNIINLGFSDYAGKYRMLSRLLAYFKRHRRILDFDRIDLNNLKRVVVKPVTTKSEARNSKIETAAKT